MIALRYIDNVVTLRLDDAACNGCGICAQVCPHPVFAPAKSRIEIADRDACIECGACVLNCPEEALSVNPGVGCAWAILKGWVTRSRSCC